MVISLKNFEVEKLFNIMKNLIIIKGDNEKLNELSKKDFEEWINKLRIEYNDNNEQKEFYDYVEDSIYHIVCYE